jgi:PAS domain S-box-containing protein
MEQGESTPPQVPGPGEEGAHEREVGRLAGRTRILEWTLEHLAQGVLTLDPGGHVEAWNQRVIELLEVPEAMLVRGRPVRDLIAWQVEHGVFSAVSAPEQQPWLKAAASWSEGVDASRWAVERYQRERRDGRIVEVQVYRAPDGAQVRTFSDITAHALARRELAASEARFRAMADAAPAYIWESDERGDPIWFNEAWLRAIGRTLEQALRQPWRERLHPRACGHPRKAFAAMVRRAEPFEVEVCVLCADGRELWLEDHGIPQFDAQGRFRGYLVYGWDVSARKAAERSLTTARDEAERANRAKSEFLSRMSHELRTPLNAVLGFAQLIEGEAQARGEKVLGEHARYIQRGGRHLLALINEMLDLARIEAGALPVMLETVALEPVLEGSSRLLGPTARDRGVRLELPPLPPPARHTLLRADPTRLRQVLLNLLSNAIKYNREGGLVRVQVQPLGDRVRIDFSDAGPGLTQAQQGRLFQAFERLDADALAIEGAGIGLTLSKALVEMMGGRIGVESEPGQGSTFWIELDRAEPAPAGAGVAPPRAGSAAATLPSRPDGRPWRVLYVEDNPVNQLLLQGMFEHLQGAELQLAASPQAALEQVGQWLPDLLLLDIQLPGMSGFELLQRLRADPQLASRPAVAVSANAMAEDLEQARKAGFDGYLTKPLMLDELQATVQRMLREGRSGAAPAG